MSRNLDEVNSWVDRVVKQLEQEIMSMDVLLEMGVGDKYKREELAEQLRKLNNLEISEGMLGEAIEAVSAITGKSVDRYAVIEQIYKEELRGFEVTDDWVDLVAKDIVYRVMREYHDGGLEMVKLVVRGAVVVHTVNFKHFLNLVIPSTKLRSKQLNTFMTQNLEHRIALRAMDLFIREAVRDGNTIGITSVLNGGKFTDFSDDWPLANLVREYDLRLDSTFKLSLRKGSFEIPDVYLPKSNDRRQKFLKMYRQVGFNNGFYD